MGYDANIQRLKTRAIFDLKGTQRALAAWCGKDLPPFPKVPNTATSKDCVELMHIGQDHWLLCASLDRETDLSVALRPSDAPSDISIVRISDTMVFLDITGADAIQIMQIASPLDVDTSVFAQDGATFSEAFGLKALIQRREGGFSIAIEQSFGDMIEDYLNRALS